ncbi:MAG TPA: MarR family transcriptional regulator [Acidobacteriaceae bacterium]|jgi:DNA-binding MarR family transcriptional regulator
MSASKPTAKAAAIRRTTLGVREYLNGYRALLEDVLRQEGLTLPQLRMLKAVADQSTEVSSAAIARFCQITPQTLQTMLERAVREGWVVRGTSERNHRIITASLTPKGEALRERGLDVAAELEQMLWKGVSRKAIEGMNDVLDRSLANLHAEADRRQAKS